MAQTTARLLLKGWEIQARVIHALMIRELTTRFGRENIGFLWMMVEPLLFAGLVSIIYRLLVGQNEHGLNIFAFIVSGYIPITMFRHAISRSVAIFTANGALLYHRQVKITDFIFVRFLIEMLGAMMAYVFIASILIALKQFPVPNDVGLFILGWLSYSFFTFSLCLIIAPLSEMSEVLEKFIPVTTYIMIPVSGLFTMAAWLQPSTREYFLMSPFVNGMEMMRKGIWGDEVEVYYNIWNPLACSVVAATIGFFLCNRARRSLTIE